MFTLLIQTTEVMKIKMDLNMLTTAVTLGSRRGGEEEGGGKRVRLLAFLSRYANNQKRSSKAALH